jgi:hypothetical protein
MMGILLQMATWIQRQPLEKNKSWQRLFTVPTTDWYGGLHATTEFLYDILQSFAMYNHVRVQIAVDRKISISHLYTNGYAASSAC